MWPETSSNIGNVHKKDEVKATLINCFIFGQCFYWSWASPELHFSLFPFVSFSSLHPSSCHSAPVLRSAKVIELFGRRTTYPKRILVFNYVLFIYVVDFIHLFSANWSQMSGSIVYCLFSCFHTWNILHFLKCHSSFTSHIPWTHICNISIFS